MDQSNEVVRKQLTAAINRKYSMSRRLERAKAMEAFLNG